MSHTMLYHAVPCHTPLYFAAMHSTLLRCHADSAVLHCTALHCTALYISRANLQIIDFCFTNYRFLHWFFSIFSVDLMEGNTISNHTFRRTAWDIEMINQLPLFSPKLFLSLPFSPPKRFQESWWQFVMKGVGSLVCKSWVRVATLEGGGLIKACCIPL